MDSVPRGALAAAAMCPSGRKVKVLWHDAMENPASGRWVRSSAGDHSTPALWYYGSQKIPYFDYYPFGRYATSGNNELVGIDPDPGLTYTTYSGKQIRYFPSHATYADHRESMTGHVKIPRTDPVFVRFNHSFGFDSFRTGKVTTYVDGGVVEYSTNGGKTWLDAGPLMSGVGSNGYNGKIKYWTKRPVPSGANSYKTVSGPSTNPIVSKSKQSHEAFVGQSKGYQSTRMVLTSFAGKDIRLRFRITADQYVGEFGWAIDDVQFYSCPLA